MRVTRKIGQDHPHAICSAETSIMNICVKNSLKLRVCRLNDKRFARHFYTFYISHSVRKCSSYYEFDRENIREETRVELNFKQIIDKTKGDTGMFYDKRLLSWNDGLYGAGGVIILYLSWIFLLFVNFLDATRIDCQMKIKIIEDPKNINRLTR